MRFAVPLSLVLVSACLGGGDPRPLGSRCSRSSDCRSPLVCEYGRCRAECVIDRDCPEGMACVVAEGDLAGGVCQLVGEGCEPGACPPGSACVGDGQCVERLAAPPTDGDADGDEDSGPDGDADGDGDVDESGTDASGDGDGDPPCAPDPSLVALTALEAAGCVALDATSADVTLTAIPCFVRTAPSDGCAMDCPGTVGALSLCAVDVGGQPACALVARRLTVAAGADIQVSGGGALAILTSEALTVDGDLSANGPDGGGGAGGAHEAPGAGTGGGGAGGCGFVDGVWSCGGGGGGGHAAVGGAGGCWLGEPGAQYGADCTAPSFVGGSGGGGGGGSLGGDGGAGGGAVFLFSRGLVTVSGQITAVGGRGRDGGAGSGGGGGGAGGTIVVEAPRIVLTATAYLGAHGAPGGAGAAPAATGGTPGGVPLDEGGAGGCDGAADRSGGGGGGGVGVILLRAARLEGDVSSRTLLPLVPSCLQTDLCE